jgi:hypothetical protein
LTRQQKKVLSFLLKGLIAGLVAWGLYTKLNDHQNLRAFHQLVRELDLWAWGTLLLVVLGMMLINWGLEVWKWIQLCKPFHRWNPWEATQSVLSGLSWAVFTPNRLGEYGGRVFFLPFRKRLLGVVAMGFGAFAQLVLTQVTGAFALAWFVQRYLLISEVFEWLLWMAAIGYSLFFLFLFSRLSTANHWFPSWKRLARIKSNLRVLRRYQGRATREVLILSLLRYVVFTSQYMVLFVVLLPEIPWTTTYLLVVLLLFIQTLLPSLDLFDFGVRSLTAGYLFSYVTHHEVVVMAIVSCIWFVNLIIPAILGAPFVYKIKFFRSNHA